MAADPAASAQPVPDDEVDDEAEEEEPFDPWASQGDQGDAGDRYTARPASPTDAAEYRQFLQFLNRRGGNSARRRGADDDDDDDDRDSRSNSGPPPTWDASTPFKDYLIRARLWLATTKAKPQSRGPMLLRGLTGVPFDDMKYLAKSDSWMKAKDNGEQLLKAMDVKELYGDDEREDMLNSLFKITYAVRRGKSEGHKEFFSRWELAIRKLSEHNITLPSEYLGFLLTMALQLNQEEVKLLMNFTQGKLSQKDVKEWVRVHETNLDLKSAATSSARAKPPAAAYHTEISDSVPEPEDIGDEGPDEQIEVLLNAMQDLSEDSGGTNAADEPGSFDEDEAREILSTMVKEHAKRRTFAAVNEAKKNKTLARGAGARYQFGKGSGKGGSKGGFEGSYRVSIEALKKRTRCANCKELGHWRKECPKPSNRAAKPADKEHGAHLLELGAHEAHFLGFEDFLRMKQAINADSGAQTTIGGSSSSTARPRPSGSASVLSAYKERVPVHDVCFLSRAQAEAQTAFDETCATVDTGCQRSAVGKETLQKLLEHQPSDLPAVIKAETHHFKSINGVSKTDRVACVPTSLGPRGCVLRPAVFEDEATKQAPFLLSLPFLLHCRSVLHLDPKDGLQLQLKRFNRVIPLHIGPTGALRVPLHQFSNVMHHELSQAMSELEHELAAPSCLHESPEERLSRQPRAVNFLRDPQHSSSSEHASRQAVSGGQHEGVQPERDRLEPDGGSSADVGSERGLQRDPLPPGRPRSSDANLRPGHPGTSSDDRFRAQQSTPCCGATPRAKGARRNEPGSMGCQAALESPDDRGPRHGDQLRERLHPDRHAQAGHWSNREPPSSDPVLLSEAHGGYSDPQGRTQSRAPIPQVSSLGEPVDPLFLFQLVGTPAVLATRRSELDSSLPELHRASSGLYQGTHDSGEVVEESKLADLTVDDRPGEVRTPGDNLRRVERLCPPGEVPRLRQGSIEDPDGRSQRQRPPQHQRLPHWAAAPGSTAPATWSPWRSIPAGRRDLRHQFR